MKRFGKLWKVIAPFLVAVVFLLGGTSAFAQTLRIGDSNPWKYGKYVGAYVELFYGSASPSGKLPKVITIASKSVVVNAESLNVRSGPGTNYQVVGSLFKGDVLKLIRETSGWYNVLLPNGQNGWVSAKYTTLQDIVQSPAKPEVPAQPAPAPDEGQELLQDAVVKGDVVNVRSGPATSYPVVTKVTAGTLVQVTRENSGWLKITTPDGKEGWVAAYLLTLKSSPPSRDDGNGPEPGAPREDDGQGSVPATPPAGGNDQNHKLTGINTEAGPDFERVVITSDGVIEYNLYNLSNPRRLVIDLAKTDKGSAPDQLAGMNTWVSGIRVAQFSLEPMVTRVVIDLGKAAAHNIALSADKKTLTVDLQEPSIKGKTVVIDAGHGGYDPGAIGVTGLKEKEVNLDIARRVKTLLEEQNANVIMTRDSDTFVSLTDRAAIANDAQADIFVSIHANSSESSGTNGTSTYFYAPSSTPALYAQREARQKLARKVQDQMGSSLGIRNIGIREANFAVLRNTTMPSILVETAFLSYAPEEALLKKPEFREKVAKAIVQGIMDYYTQV